MKVNRSTSVPLGPTLGGVSTVSVHVWSDVVCPWCYIGKRHLEQALAQFLVDTDPELRVKLLWHSFELDPSAPTRLDPNKSHAEFLAAKYGTSIAGAQSMIDRVFKIGQQRGIDFRFDQAQSGNTFGAHQLLHWARTQPLPSKPPAQPQSLIGQGLRVQGAQDLLKEQLMKAYFTDGTAIGDPDALVGVAHAAGLDEEGAYNALRSGQFKVDVRQDEQRAQQLGIGGVPFFLIGRYAVSGAQPPELLLEVLHKAVADLSDGQITELVNQQDDVLCESGACAIA